MFVLRMWVWMTTLLPCRFPTTSPPIFLRWTRTHSDQRKRWIPASDSRYSKFHCATWRWILDNPGCPCRSDTWVTICLSKRALVGGCNRQKFWIKERSLGEGGGGQWGGEEKVNKGIWGEVFSSCCNERKKKYQGFHLPGQHIFVFLPLLRQLVKL